MSPPQSLWDFLPFFLAGIPVTIEVTFLAMAVAVPAAVALALGRKSPHALVRWPTGFVIELFRGSSALVQLFWAFYVLPLFGLTLPPLACGVVVLGLNEGSYMSEVVRAGLDAVPKGQREAAVALGLPAHYRLFRIVLPQALPLMLPPFGNELITMLKFTALVSLVTIQDLSFRATLIGETLGHSGPIFALTMVVYFGIALILGQLVRLIERTVAHRSGRHVAGVAAPHGALLAAPAPSPVPAWALGGGG
jgi:polar amino acid transport system permease protein